MASFVALALEFCSFLVFIRDRFPWWNPRYCDSLLYRGSGDNNEFSSEVTGWAWNKRTRTRTMMTAMRMRVKGSIVAVRLTKTLGE